VDENIEAVDMDQAIILSNLADSVDFSQNQKEGSAKKDVARIVNMLYKQSTLINEVWKSFSDLGICDTKTPLFMMDPKDKFTYEQDGMKIKIESYQVVFLCDFESIFKKGSDQVKRSESIISGFTTFLEGIGNRMTTMLETSKEKKYQDFVIKALIHSKTKFAFFNYMFNENADLKSQYRKSIEEDMTFLDTQKIKDLRTKLTKRDGKEAQTITEKFELLNTELVKIRAEKTKKPTATPNKPQETSKNTGDKTVPLPEPRPIQPLTTQDEVIATEPDPKENEEIKDFKQAINDDFEDDNPELKECRPIDSIELQDHTVTIIKLIFEKQGKDMIRENISYGVIETLITRILPREHEDAKKMVCWASSQMGYLETTSFIDKVKDAGCGYIVHAENLSFSMLDLIFSCYNQKQSDKEVVELPKIVLIYSGEERKPREVLLGDTKKSVDLSHTTTENIKHFKVKYPAVKKSEGDAQKDLNTDKLTDLFISKDLEVQMFYSEENGTGKTYLINRLLEDDKPTTKLKEGQSPIQYLTIRGEIGKQRAKNQDQKSTNTTFKPYSTKRLYKPTKWMV